MANQRLRPLNEGFHFLRIHLFQLKVGFFLFFQCEIMLIHQMEFEFTLFYTSLQGVPIIAIILRKNLVPFLLLESVQFLLDYLILHYRTFKYYIPRSAIHKH